ncbi:MAG: TetR/AcrR family transcriptional regulator [Gammaproteobacteria bacterium]|nr:TetR/AcrR family transcriptional regulator [Gammaproteobacteria bacterium]
MAGSQLRKQESRHRILSSAYRLFSAKGYDNVTINEVMADAGLTHGGFYAHFANKSELYQHAITHAAQNSGVMQAKPSTLDEKAWVALLVREYLHQNNLHGDCKCPLASLASDVVSREPAVRKTYTQTFKGLNKLLAQYTHAYSNIGMDIVLATTAMMIGGLAVARALDDKNLAENLLLACRQQAVQLLMKELKVDTAG